MFTSVNAAICHDLDMQHANHLGKPLGKGNVGPPHVIVDKRLYCLGAPRHHDREQGRHGCARHWPVPEDAPVAPPDPWGLAL